MRASTMAVLDNHKQERMRAITNNSACGLYNYEQDNYEQDNYEQDNYEQERVCLLYGHSWHARMCVYAPSVLVAEVDLALTCG